jgi:lipoprotein-anchoring transpeptidase ErfK/SrfK
MANTLSRRHILVGLAGTVATPAIAQSVDGAGTVEIEAEVSRTIRRNTSTFRTADWREYFSNLNGGAILVDIESRALHYWASNGQDYRLFPCSVPLTEDLTRRGRTKIVRKVDGPSWRPTPAMKKRNPEWPDYVGPGPDNPLGTHALYLSWTYYRIHGTHDTRKIGRRSSNGCVGLFNQHIAELFQVAKVGTQVLLI